MQKLTLLTAGAWALGLLVGLFAWLSPDSPLFPAVVPGLLLVGAALLLFLVGMVWIGSRRSSPREPVAAYYVAIGPLCAAAIALPLAARGLLPHPALPLAFIVIVGSGLRWWGRGKEGAPMGWVHESGFTIVILAALLLVVPALLLGIGGQVLWAVATPSFGPTVGRLKVTNVLAPSRFAPRAGITATAAGLALQAIANTGTPRRESLLLDVPGSSPRPWIPDGGPFNGWSGDSVVRHALRGLTNDERTWLRQLGTHPGLPLLDTVAFTVALDPWAALKTPLPRHLNAFSLPIPSIMSIRSAARMQLYRAALAAADRKPAMADSLARSVISIGLRIRDDSDLLLNTLVGNVIAREGGLALGALWKAGGKVTEGDALLAALQYPARVADTTLADNDPSPRQLRAGLILGAAAGENGRAIRFEHLMVLGMSSCTDLRELLYGPTPDATAAFAASAPLFQRTPMEREVFALMSFGVASNGGAGAVAPVFRPAAAAFGRRPVAACLQLVSGTSMD
jgi:hypothetical protein